jgi:hypothetical protein
LKIYLVDIFRFWAYPMKVIPGNAQCALRLISTFLLKKMSNYFALRVSVINFINQKTGHENTML